VKRAASHSQASIRFSNLTCMNAVTPTSETRTDWRCFGASSVYLPDFLYGFDRLVAFDAETTGKRTPDADFIRKQPYAWRAPGIIIEVGLVEMLRDGEGWRKGETWSSRVNPDGPIDPEAIKVHGFGPPISRTLNGSRRSYRR
jgi:hypothetical protein